MEAFEETSSEFRRNLMIVLAVHVSLLGGLWWIGGRTKAPPPEQITWLDGGGLGVAAPPEESIAPPPVEPPPPEEPVAPPPEPEAKPEATEEKEIIPPQDPIPSVPEKPEEPAPQPTPAPTPKPTPAPTLKHVKATPKPTPKTTPKPAVTKRSTPKPEPAPKRTVAKVTETPRSTPKPAESTEAPNGGTGNSGKPGGVTAEGNGGKGAPGGTPNGAEVMSYFSEVGETFRPIWKKYKPVTVEGTGDELVARVLVRIDSSGRVENARLVRSTGNQEVDTSVEKAIPEFLSVPPPPSALLKNKIFEANMDVILRL